MLTETLIEDPRWQTTGLGDVAETAARATLQHLGLGWKGYEIAILACDDARIADLNAEFRDNPTPTNVLSWPSLDLAPDDAGAAPQRPPDPDPLLGEFLGDIAIAYETCDREAQAAGKHFADHVTHLMVHGVLHLLGYDHARDGDATLMERIEAEILGKLGIADPYS